MLFLAGMSCLCSRLSWVTEPEYSWPFIVTPVFHPALISYYFGPFSCSHFFFSSSCPLQENQEGVQDLVISDTELKQVVYAFKCNKSTLQVKGKLNSITVGKNKTACRMFRGCVSSWRGTHGVRCEDGYCMKWRRQVLWKQEVSCFWLTYQTVNILSSSVDFDAQHMEDLIPVFLES